MVADPSIYAELVDKKVDIKTADGTFYEKATLRAASAVGVVFKPRGSAQTDVLLPADIVSIVEPEVGPKLVRARRLARPLQHKVREHLALHHGYKLSDINAMDDETALRFHDGLDHSELGHVHRELTEAELELQRLQAEEQAELDAEG